MGGGGGGGVGGLGGVKSLCILESPHFAEQFDIK